MSATRPTRHGHRFLGLLQHRIGVVTGLSSMATYGPTRGIRPNSGEHAPADSLRRDAVDDR